MAGETLNVRVTAPDLWREERLTCAPDTPIAELKAMALPALLRKDAVDPSQFYVEYFEKEVLDESQSLADLGVPDGAVISIRQFDLDHPRPFSG